MLGGGWRELGLVDVVDGYCVCGDDLSHFLDLCFEGCDVVVVALDGALGFVVLLLQDFLLRGDSLQFFGECFCCGLKLLSFGDEILQFQFVLE